MATNTLDCEGTMCAPAGMLAFEPLWLVVAVKNTRAPACAKARAAPTAPNPYPSALTTAATAALGASFRKKFQFSTMAACSTLSRASRGGSAGEGGEAGELSFEMEVHRFDRAVAVLADD